MLSVSLLAACGALPDKPLRAATFDFGPGAASTSPALSLNAKSAVPPLSLGDVDTTAALDGTAVLYRLGFANPQELRPYAQARWSMPPAQLVRQRLVDYFSARRVVLNAGDGYGQSAIPWQLRVELDEFSQWFESASASSGTVRLRITVIQASPQGEKLLGQRSLRVQRPAPSADAAGGVRALADATDAAVLELDRWLLQLR